MKTKKIYLVVGIVSLFLLACAFTIRPVVRLVSARNNKVDVSYVGATVEEGKLVVYVNYEGYGEHFEIAKDITVATDRQFTNTLRIAGCVPKEEYYEYTFRDIIKDTDTIYIAPPVLYVPIEINAASIPLTTGSVLETEDGNSWFTISTITVGDAVNGICPVSAMIIPNGDFLPRFPRIIVGEKTFGGIVSSIFDDNAVLSSGEFIIYVEANTSEEASTMLMDATLMLDQALLRVYAKDAVFSSNIKSLNVVVD